MRKILLISASILCFHAHNQEPTTIHQEQQEYYNAQGKSTEWYEENVNTEIYATEKMTGCTLDHVVYGWHPYWVGSAYTNYNWDLLSHFSFFSYEVDPSTGDPITTHGWSTSSAVDAALASGNTKVTLCVTLFGSSGLTTFLTNATAKQNLIDNLINLVQTRGAHGVNIDFEGLPSSQKTNFANFMVDLSNQMHTAIPNSEVSTVLYAVDWSNVFDFAIMDPVVDHYIIMGYAYYYQGSSNTGPCDPLYHFGSSYNYTLSKTITNYLQAGASADKLVMGLPYYGYEWPTTSSSIPSSTTGTGSAKTFANVMNNTSGNYSSGNHYWDADSYSDVYTFNDGEQKQCFITLEDGFRKRLEHIRRTGIAGIGIWALGYDNGYNELWNGIEEFITECYEDSCAGMFHDFGGPSKSYYNYEDYTWTIAPPGASSIDVEFTMFNVELNYDTLFIYDGPDNTSPLIGAYTGTNSPGTFTTTQGELTFYFKSDLSTVNPGFLANYQCNSIPPPSAGFSAPSSTTICVTEAIDFTNTSSNASSYYWIFENGIPATSTDQNPSVQFMSTGTYNVTLYAIEGTDTSQYDQTITVDVVNYPTASFTSNSPVTASNAFIYFTNNSTNAFSYFWDFGDGNTSADSNPWNLYSSAGIYTVTLVANNFVCPSDTTIMTVEVIDDLNLDNSNSEDLVVFPNPFTNEFQVSGFMSDEPVRFELVDMDGRIVSTQKLEVINHQITIKELDNIESGNYLIRLTQDNEVTRIPVVKG